MIIEAPRPWTMAQRHGQMDIRSDNHRHNRLNSRRNLPELIHGDRIRFQIIMLRRHADAGEYGNLPIRFFPRSRHKPMAKVFTFSANTHFANTGFS
jgi:hypothetical protein